MNMTVMNVREVRVAVLQRVVPVRMLVLDAWRDVCRVSMAVVLVVNMRMVVFHCFVLMRMLMTLAQMQPEPERHQGAGKQQVGCQRLADEQRHRQNENNNRQRVAEKFFAGKPSEFFHFADHFTHKAEESGVMLAIDRNLVGNAS